MEVCTPKALAKMTKQFDEELQYQSRLYELKKPGQFAKLVDDTNKKIQPLTAQGGGVNAAMLIDPVAYN